MRYKGTNEILAFRVGNHKIFKATCNGSKAAERRRSCDGTALKTNDLIAHTPPPPNGTLVACTQKIRESRWNKTRIVDEGTNNPDGATEVCKIFLNKVLLCCPIYRMLETMFSSLDDLCLFPPLISFILVIVVGLTKKSLLRREGNYSFIIASW